MDTAVTLLSREDLWIGVMGGVIATMLVGVIVYAFRSSFRAIGTSFSKGAQNDKVINDSLEDSGPYAAFAYGIAQARALRFFILAMLLAAIGDSQIGWFLAPLNFVMAIASVVFLFLAFKWLNKIETKGINILQGNVK